MATDTNQTDPQAVPATTMAIQLTQVRVPLDDAREALSTQDEAGRQPIVVMPKQAQRIRNGFVLAGIIAILAGLFVDVTLPLRGSAVTAGSSCGISASSPRPSRRPRVVIGPPRCARRRRGSSGRRQQVPPLGGARRRCGVSPSDRGGV